MNGRMGWRLACVSRNPLVRTADRVENAVLALVVLLALAALPFTFAVGSEVYAAQQESAADRHPATAVLLTDAPPPLLTAQGVPMEVTAPVKASWRLPDGSVRTGAVSAGRGSVRGTTVPIWLNRTGDPVSPPGAAAVTAIGVATLSWLTFVAFLAGVFWFLRAAMDRRRYARWAQEWAHLPSHL
ncbi:Rv1733c family protein [Amycolatopsis pithecellobii]|uniref:Transmembrane protein n=1 Tax=Amycolatopsis pithecellobii TaxID=664692 RepID=A0A6N7Z0M3_9PSEU|nr:hypothetical protein [Amycolatopsis pithecellobii]MTD53321.1 hypothetical protein [Amycolatopsis pithecellobii]